MIVPINGKPTYIPTPLDTSSTSSGDLTPAEFIICVLSAIATAMFVYWITTRRWRMKALRTISGTVLLLVAGFLKMTFSIMQTHLRHVTLKEQLTANYPINQVNNVIETYTTTVSWLFFVIGVGLLWPIIYGYVKEQIKLLSSKGED